MVIRFCSLVLFAIYIVQRVATESCLNPNNLEDNVILWESLFTKINTLLSESTKIAETQKELTNSLAELEKQRAIQERTLSEFMESTGKQYTELKESLGEQQRKLSYFMDQYLNNNVEWTTIMRRQDGSVDFYRNWTEYQNGFGDPDGEFFIGLEKLHNLTTEGAPQELMIILKDYENEKRIAKYDLFKIGNETEKYALNELGKYSGDAGDSFIKHAGMSFTTFDEDNDDFGSDNCAKAWKGAWWYHKCYDSHLFGPYDPRSKTTARGIGWHTWKSPMYTLKFAEMKIRPKFIEDV